MPSKPHETRPARGFPGSSFKYTPLQHVRVLFVSFTQGLFAEAPAGSYHWTPDLENTEIIITDENPIQVEKLGQRPAISFTRGPVQLHSLGLDDMEFYDFRTEQKVKNVLVPGTMSVNCCSRSDIESENIAWVVAEHIWLLRELLMKKGFFEIGRQPQIGSPSQAGSVVTGDQGTEWYVTTVTIPFQFTRQSSFTPLGKKIAQSIELNIQTVTPPVGSKGVPQAGHEFPIHEVSSPPPPFAPFASDVYGRTPSPTGSNVSTLPLQPHPLNPASNVTIRFSRPNQSGLRPPSFNGRPLPIRDPADPES